MDSARPAAHPAVPAAAVQPRPWIGCTIGGSSPLVEHRQVGVQGLCPPATHNGRSPGWSNFVDSWIKPLIAHAGAERFVLMNPFGTLPTENPDVEQYTHAYEADLDWLAGLTRMTDPVVHIADNKFVLALRPVVAAGKTVMAYLGLPHMSRIGLPRKQSDEPEWRRRVLAALAPVREAHLWLCFDSLYDACGPAERSLIEQLKLETPVYGEGWPMDAAGAAMPRMLTDSNVRMIATGKWRESRGAVEPAGFVGKVEVIHQMDRPRSMWDRPKEKVPEAQFKPDRLLEWQAELAAYDMELGLSPMIPSVVLMRPDGRVLATVEQFLARGRELRARSGEAPASIPGAR